MTFTLLCDASAMSERVFPISRARRNPKRELADINRRFARVSLRVERWNGRRWYRRHWKLIIASIALALVGGWSIADIKPNTVFEVTRHLLAAPNCEAARAVGLAPARRGQPGYWPKHDADNDGIACEPWPR